MTAQIDDTTLCGINYQNQPLSNVEELLLLAKNNFTDLQKQNKERKDAIDDVIAMAVAGAYSPEAALDELGHHDLSQAEEREARIKLTRAKNVRTKTPSKSDLDSWREMGIITSTEYQPSWCKTRF